MDVLAFSSPAKHILLHLFGSSNSRHECTTQNSSPLARRSSVRAKRAAQGRWLGLPRRRGFHSYLSQAAKQRLASASYHPLSLETPARSIKGAATTLIPALCSLLCPWVLCPLAQRVVENCCAPDSLHSSIHLAHSPAAGLAALKCPEFCGR